MDSTTDSFDSARVTEEQKQHLITSKEQSQTRDPTLKLRISEFDPLANTKEAENGEKKDTRLIDNQSLSEEEPKTQEESSNPQTLDSSSNNNINR
ncbi:16353_t:CDS:2, partial [Acaulospora colombiana]